MSGWIYRIAAFGVASGVGSGASAELIGAQAVLDELQTISSEDASAVTNDAKILFQEMADFAERAPEVTGESVAAEWLQLCDKFGRLSRSDVEEVYVVIGSPRAARILNPLDVLPGPSTWPVIRKQLRDRDVPNGVDGVKLLTQRLLFSILTQDTEGQEQDIVDLREQAKNLDVWQGEQVRESVRAVVSALRRMRASPEDVRQSIEEQLRALTEVSRPSYAYREPRIEVPDIVSILGEEEARDLLLKVLKTPGALLDIPGGEATRKLAKQILLRNPTVSEVPQWQLVTDLDDVALYEAIEKHEAVDPDLPASESDTDEASQFNTGEVSSIESLFALGDSLGQEGDSEQEAEQQSAKLVYMLGLIADERTDDAVKVAQSLPHGQVGVGVALPGNALQVLVERGHSVDLYQFFKKLLSEDPELPFWHTLISLSARVGGMPELIVYLEQCLQDTTLKPQRIFELEQSLAWAYFASDRIDDGVAIQRNHLGLKADAFDASYAEMLTLAQRDGAATLFRIGCLLDRSDLKAEGMNALQKISKEDSSSRWWTMNAIVSMFMEAGDWEAAETILRNVLRKQVSAAKAGVQNFHDAASLLTYLTDIYVSSGRHQDALMVVDQYPYWGFADLANAQDLFFRDPSLTFIVAKALHGVGRIEESSRLLQSAIVMSSGSDKAYELYVQEKGSDALPFLNKLITFDPFQERPHIWKAHVLRSEGRFDEALAELETAIAIDPSDGEQGKGDRMRVYEEMAEVLAAKGETDKAVFFRDVVQSIRMAEEADDYYTAGLLSRGVAGYEKALTLFGDAYCIQSRIALQLEALGNYKAAEEHYKRAYELMPSSFGRKESHCFGCEGIFRGSRGQKIAERVFLKLQEEQVDNPRLHYLFGFLRESQGRPVDAFSLYQRAVELDPHYINAWVRLETLSNRMWVPAKERSEIAFNLMRIDPFRLHTEPDYSSIDDFGRLWKILDSMGEYPFETSEKLYEMTASKKALESDLGGRNYSYRVNQDQKAPQFSDVLSGHALTSKLLPATGLKTDRYGFY